MSHLRGTRGMCGELISRMKPWWWTLIQRVTCWSWQRLCESAMHMGDEERASLSSLICSHLNRSSLPHKTFSALRIHFYRLDPTGSPTGNRSHPEAKHPRLDIATEAFLHPNRPLRKPRIHIGRNGLMCVTLRDWNGSSCTMVVNWKEATMYGATWHDNVMVSLVIRSEE